MGNIPKEMTRLSLATALSPSPSLLVMVKIKAYAQDKTPPAVKKKLGMMIKRTRTVKAKLSKPLIPCCASNFCKRLRMTEAENPVRPA